MEIKEKEKFNQLFDLYHSLLTSYQVEVFTYYYVDDLSLNEIAENNNVSKNAIFKIIKRVEELLLDYENKLGLLRKYEEIIKICKDDKNEISKKIIKIIEG